MTNAGASQLHELVSVIRQVRSRWRMKLLLRGALILFGGGLLALILASLGLQASKFSPSSVFNLRVALFAVFGALAILWIVRPLRRRVSDLQVALYLEEHEPRLQAAILSAVDVSAAPEGVPPIILQRMVEQAVEKCRTVQGVQAVGQKGVRRYALGTATIAAIAILSLVIGPEFLRQGASALLVITNSAEAASPYAIQVKPGDVTVPKGSDQSIGARLAGFRSTDVAVMTRPFGGAKFERAPARRHRRSDVVRGDALRSQAAHRVLHRGRRREVADLHDEGGGAAGG